MKKQQTAVCISGAGGRMGRELTRAALAAPDLRLVCAVERPGGAHIGKDAGALCGASPCGVIVSAAADVKDFNGAQAVVDFSLPAAVLQNLPRYARARVAAVIGATGFNDAEMKKIKAAAKKIPLVFSPNMSPAVNVMLRLLAAAAKGLAADGGYDVEVFEAHHRGKKDAPSGTALRMGEVLANATGAPLKKRGVFNRRGRNVRRLAGEIGFSVARGGGIAGEHRVMFAGDGDVLEISHRAFGRAHFVDGALRAARFAARAKPGFYDISEALGLE